MSKHLARFNNTMHWDSVLHWVSKLSFHLSFSSDIIPRTFLLFTWSIVWLLNSMCGFSENCLSFLLEAISNNSLFLTFTVNLFVSSQLLIPHRSLFIFVSTSAGNTPALDMFVSSANVEACVWLWQFGRDFIQSENSICSRLDPWGTQHVILFS